MPCTTILVGKKASYDGSTMIARNDDAGGNHFYSKKICDRTSGGAAEGVQICDLSCGDPASGASHALQRSS